MTQRAANSAKMKRSKPEPEPLEDSDLGL